MSHHHHHPRGKNILFAAVLNIGFTIIEVIGGLLTNSVAILSDALHDLGDSIALISAYVAEKQADKPSDKKRTFGYARISVFSALLNAVILVVGSIFILIEAVQRLFSPEPVHAGGMILLAVFGVLVNSAAFLKLKHGVNVNEKVLSWHMMEDVLGWVAVLVGAIIIYFTDFFLIDPILTVGYTLFILWGVFGILKSVANILLQGVPCNVDIDEIREALGDISGVVSTHDMHIWSLDGEHNVLTCHVVVTSEWFRKSGEVRDLVNAQLDKYHVSHTTIEIEESGDCSAERCGF